jgi:hypothetical protein
MLLFCESAEMLLRHYPTVTASVIVSQFVRTSSGSLECTMRILSFIHVFRRRTMLINYDWSICTLHTSVVPM